MEDATLKTFRDIFDDTPLFSPGGWNETNVWGVIEDNQYSALAVGRYYTSKPDLVERLRLGFPLNNYDRATFHGPMKDRKAGHLDYPTMGEMKQKFA
ncbi:hypothetical protein BJ878DRAFT_542920 [Calycina marina]|uniref:Uncharacterized protein n=1 Tax=Calycina marina TaxID=1763456 RepID=A0A9P7Z1S4_9HELO|nr:hypothetical protein BJ878DRAFT_542920 [Calycina marina]